jgi:SAM-dependent methyltransferase
MGEQSRRAEHEIRHGEWLARHDPEKVWGWGTPAGLLRARRRADLIAEGAGLGPGTRALEVGCGTGTFTELFAQSGSSIVAVDISPDLLERARQRGLPPERVRFLARRFEDCDVEGPFDAVIGSSVLHHLDVLQALPRLRRVLKPGGWLSFAEPNYLNPQVFLERRFRFLPMFRYTSPDETAFVRWPFARMLRRAGFVEVSIVPFDWLHPHTPPRLIAAVRAAGRVIESVPGLCEFAGSLYIRARCPDRP